MRNSLGLRALVAASLVSGAASATPITIGASKLVIDVQFWGRQQIVTANPTNPGEDIVSYGDPVQGAFRVSADDAPAPLRTTAFPDNPHAASYGSDSGIRAPSSASFVTSSWSSTFPFHGDVAPTQGGEATDHVIVGDGLRFFPDEPRKDWFQVVDSFTANPGQRDEVQHALFITLSTPLDIIQGVGLDQEFDLEDAEGYGFFRTTVDGTRKLFDFIVDRVRVSPNLVCRP
jgi:hypothetical protein